MTRRVNGYRRNMRSLRLVPDWKADAKVEPYVLRELGDKAAARFVDNGTPLVDAVAQVLKSSGRDFNKHHVQRVVEYTNLRAFRALRQPGPGEIGKVVEFPDGPATAIAVLDKVRTAKAGTEAKMGTIDRLISRPPGGAVKMAEVRGPVYGLLLDLQAAADVCRSEAMTLESKLSAARGEICRYAEHALRHGAELGDIQTVLAAGCPDRPDMLKAAMDLVLSRVAGRVGLGGESGAESLAKRAHAGQPNPQHPLVLRMSEYVKVADLVDTKRRAADIINQNRKMVQAGG